MSFCNPYYQPSSVINLDGLVIYLPFDDNRQYLAPSVIKDYGPNNITVGYTGSTAPTYINMPIGVNTTSGTTGSSNFNKGIYLTASTIISAATNSGYAGDSTGKKLSVFTWISQNHIAITPADRSIAGAGYINGSTGWRILTRESAHDILVVVGTTTASISNVTPQRSTAHVGFTYDGANIRVYKNGKQVGSNVACTATLSTSGTNQLFVGGGCNLAAFPGYIDEFCIFKRTLSAAEVAGLYSGTTPLIYTTGNTFFNYDQHVLNWANSMSASPSTYVIQNLSTMVQKLKTAGVWAKLDRLWIFGLENRQHANRCLKTTSDLTVVGSPTWTQNTCWSGWSTSNYLNTGFAGSAGTAYTQNSASVGVYSLSATNGTVTDIGATAAAAGNGTDFNSKGSTAVQTVKINAAATGNFTVNATAIGFNAASRINSTTTNGYKYGGLLTGTLSNASVSPSTNNMFIGCRNNNGTPDQAATGRQYSMAFIGGGLTTLEMDQFAQAIQIFGNTMGWSQTTQ